ncbi:MULTISPECIES: hypothetical protein [Nostocales]|uniref:hypothetical protein n=1 Tax=Nostocales TaxID=1161 RepID=UPI0028BE58B4|nr:MULTISPECIES: hypothetical protein [Nostocales]
MAYDNICRYLTSEYPLAFVQWLLNTATEIKVLPTELSLEPIRSDALFQVRTYALVTRKQDFEIASLRRNDGNT